ncbi:unnamed protein product, partial [Didymodactylos carnosus]
YSRLPHISNNKPSLLKYSKLLSIRTYVEDSKNKIIKSYQDDKSFSYFDQFRFLKHLTSTPAPPLFFGLAGLIPFVSVPVYMYSTGIYLPELVYAQLAYSSVIISYLGGIRWGANLYPQNSEETTINTTSILWKQYFWSILPSIAAWTALVLPGRLSLICALVSLQAFCMVDIMIPGYPLWFKSQRIFLTTVASLTIVATLILSFILHKRDRSKEKTKHAV